MSRLLSVESLNVSRGGRMILSDVSLTLDVGEIVLIIGHNGSGKSTLLLAIAGLLPHQAGTIRWAAAGARCRPVVLLQEASAFLAHTALANVAVGAVSRFRPSRSIERRLRVDIVSRMPDLAEQLEMPVGQLSGGQQRLVGLARCAVTGGGVYLLDEPTVGLNRTTAQQALGEVVGAARSNGGGVLMIEHNVGLGRPLATRLCVLRDGAISYDGTPDVLDDPERLRGIYL